MKIRHGFVSNSSSSSFVVIGTGNFTPIEESIPEYTIGEHGHLEFGWERVKYKDVFSKINFAWLIAYYEDNAEWFGMLESLIKEHFHSTKVTSIISEDYNSDNSRWGYIDHASTAGESNNGKIFDSIETLENFIFSEDSHIQGDNDN